LDRVTGRYDRLEDEQTRPRRMFALSRPTPVDMFQLARSLAFLGRLVDTEYGSATFSSARGPTELELRVSTSGLLFRSVGQTAQGLSPSPTRQRQPRRAGRPRGPDREAPVRGVTGAWRGLAAR